MRKRRLQFVAALLVAAATAGLLTQLGLGGSDKVEIGNGSVSALAHARSAVDALPQSVLDYPFAERNFASRSGGGSRLLQQQGSLKLYAVPGKEPFYRKFGFKRMTTAMAIFEDQAAMVERGYLSET